MGDLSIILIINLSHGGAVIKLDISADLSGQLAACLLAWCFYGIATLVGYLMPNLIYIYIYICIWCILTFDPVVNQRFCAQDAHVKISNSCHMVEQKCAGVLK